MGENDRALSSGDLFAPGSRVADRFRIVRAVGQGGMGVVYEAIDEKLGRTVALKCARAGHGNRLPPEARAAREVSHFNVCKVHDLHSAATDAGEIDFLSMEFIEGETLSTRIRRNGPLSDSEAREIARQICSGLGQAHRQGVIHGDLKCSNVLLAKTPGGGVRAVITDFGLARIDFGASSEGESGAGTAEYMAPELFLGQRASVASDLYALGVLFHVMLTGEAPRRVGESPTQTMHPEWEPDSRASTRTEAVRVDAAEWKREIADLRAPWKGIVTRCIAAKPEERFAASESVAAALEPSRWIWKSALGLAVVLLIAFLYWKQQATNVETPVSLAILPFTVEGDAIPSAAGIAQDLAERLSGARKSFAVIPPRENQTQKVDSPKKARATVGATHTLQTNLKASGGQVVANAWVTDVVTGQRIGDPLSGTYAQTDPATLAKALIATVTQAFRLRSRVPPESVNGGAYADYTQGMELLRRDTVSAAQAIPMLERAAQLDSRSALPFAALAEAQLQRFDRAEGAEWLERAKENVAQAKSRNADSVPVLLASGLVEQEGGQYERAIRDYSRATELNPSNADAWRRLAIVYELANRPEEAVANFNRAVQVQPDYFRQYVAFGNFYLNRNEFAKAEQQYRRVTTIAPALADGHMNVGLALMRQGRFAEAEQAFARAMQLRETSLLQSNLGSLYLAEERYADAARQIEKSVATTPSALRYRNLGDAYRHLGKKNEAMQAYRKGLAMVEQDVVRNPRQASARVRLATLCAFLGDTRRAEHELDQAKAFEPENTSLSREIALAYEILKEREKTLAVLQNAPKYLLEDLNRQPDARSLQKDPRFQELLQRKSAQ